MAQQPNPHNAQLANLEPGEAATTAVTILTKATINTARAHPKITGSWMLGLALVVFATGFRVSDELRLNMSKTSRPLTCPNRLGRGGGAVTKCASRALVCSTSAVGWFSCDDRCQYAKRGGGDRRGPGIGATYEASP